MTPRGLLSFPAPRMATASSFHSCLVSQGCTDLRSPRQMMQACGTSRRATRISCQNVNNNQSGEIPSRSHYPDNGSSMKTMPASSSFGDWRSFRSALVSQQPMKEYWAHEISSIEPGCVFLATNRLDRHSLLQKSVIFILDVWDDSCRGIILNKQMPFSLEDTQCMDPQLISLGAMGCPAYVAGQLMLLHSKPEFHMLTTNKGLRGYKTIVNGMYLGNRDALASTVESVRRGCVQPDELRIHVGEMEWESKHLDVEIRAFKWWKVISCSNSALLKVPASELWQSLNDACSNRHISDS